MLQVFSFRHEKQTSKNVVDTKFTKFDKSLRITWLGNVHLLHNHFFPDS